jgi:hypothetical protein
MAVARKKTLHDHILQRYRYRKKRLRYRLHLCKRIHVLVPYLMSKSENYTPTGTGKSLENRTFDCHKASH